MGPQFKGLYQKSPRKEPNPIPSCDATQNGFHKNAAESGIYTGSLRFLRKKRKPSILKLSFN
jgi:hypothetical protein